MHKGRCVHISLGSELRGLRLERTSEKWYGSRFDLVAAPVLPQTSVWVLICVLCAGVQSFGNRCLANVSVSKSLLTPFFRWPFRLSSFGMYHHDVCSWMAHYSKIFPSAYLGAPIMSLSSLLIEIALYFIVDVWWLECHVLGVIMAAVWSLSWRRFVVDPHYIVCQHFS